MSEIVLGNKVEDRVSGFKGIATARHEYMNGCVQLTISGRCDEKGESRVLDVDVEQVKRLTSGLLVAKKKRTGGPSRGREVSRVA